MTAHASTRGLTDIPRKYMSDNFRADGLYCKQGRLYFAIMILA